MSAIVFGQLRRRSIVPARSTCLDATPRPRSREPQGRQTRPTAYQPTNTAAPTMSAAIDNEDLEELSISMPAPRRGGASTTRTVDFAEVPAEPVAPSPAEIKSKDPKASQRLGQYTIVKTLGEGSFGKVKLATHQVSGQKVALKIINRKRLVTRDMAGRIEREIQYLQLLRHPHIIKL